MTSNFLTILFIGCTDKTYHIKLVQQHCNCISGVRLIRFNVKATEAKPTMSNPSVEIKVSQENNGTEAEHQLDVSLSGKTGWMGYDDEF